MLRKLFPLTAAVGICGALATTTHAMTIGLGTPSLSGRVSITEPVTVSCSPFDPSLTQFADVITVNLEQASGRAIATGFGSTGSFSPAPLLFVCDGSQTTIPVTLLASPTGPPFHGGQAVFTASASAEAGTPCFPGSVGCYLNITSQSASTPPTTLRLH